MYPANHVRCLILSKSNILVSLSLILSGGFRKCDKAQPGVTQPCFTV